MMSFEIVMMIIIIILIISICANQIKSYGNFHKHKLVSTEELQIKTGRNHENCIIKSICANQTKSDDSFHKHKLVSTEELQMKTGRNYENCIIKSEVSEVNNINTYLKKNPQKIPKIIHQIWIGPKQIPWKWINSFKIQFMSKFPGWKYYLWTDKEVSTFNFKNRKQYDSEQSYNGKSDILRYEILYNFGGIYIDADTHWLGLDLNDLIEQTNYTGFFAARECQTCKESLASGVVGSSINNPIAKYVIESINKHYFTCNQYPAYQTIGPYLIDQVLYNFNITIFPYYYFYPIYWLSKKSYQTSIEKQKQLFPSSYMTQFGYTTNSLG